MDYICVLCPHQIRNFACSACSSSARPDKVQDDEFQVFSAPTISSCCCSYWCINRLGNVRTDVHRHEHNVHDNCADVLLLLLLLSATVECYRRQPLISRWIAFKTLFSAPTRTQRQQTNKTVLDLMDSREMSSAKEVWKALQLFDSAIADEDDLRQNLSDSDSIEYTQGECGTVRWPMFSYALWLAINSLCFGFVHCRL